MRARRVPHERARWFSAVLIVTAIAAVSVAVRWQPRAVPPVAPLVASHLLPLVAAPVVHTGAMPIVELPVDAGVEPVDAAVDRGRHATGTTTPAVAAVAQPSPAAPLPAWSPPAGGRDGVDAQVAPGPAAVLPARPLYLPGIVALAEPARASAERLARATGSSDADAAAPDSRGFVEIPAVVVARAVTVAGRGIRTGVRATTAVVRAVF